MISPRFVRFFHCGVGAAVVAANVPTTGWRQLIIWAGLMWIAGHLDNGIPD